MNTPTAAQEQILKILDWNQLEDTMGVRDGVIYLIHLETGQYFLLTPEGQLRAE